MSRVLTFLVLLVYLLLPISSLAESLAADRDYRVPVARNEIKLMSYNVENLFDAEHDPDKRDYEFLPKNSPWKSKCKEKIGRTFNQSTPTEWRPKYAGGGQNFDFCTNTDWTDERVELKLNQIKTAVNAQGVLPDILVLVEVENENVVGRLADKLGFDGFEMTNSPDDRGIDVAVLYRTNKLTLVSYIERVAAHAQYPTRNLSAATFRLSKSLGGGLLAVFPTHWPSQRNSSSARIAIARDMRQLIDEVRTKYSRENFSFVVTGDFNTLESEKPNPINSVLLDPSWSAQLTDVHALAKNQKSPMIPKMPPGTYYYGVNDAWNELDHIFVDATLADGRGLEVDPQSFRINAPDLISRQNKSGEKVPFRYNHNTSNPQYLGYSDHYAVLVKLFSGSPK